MESLTYCSSKRYRRQKLKIWWSRNAEPHAKMRTRDRTHKNTHKQPNWSNAVGWSDWGGGERPGFTPSSHSSQNRLLIFRRNGSASELVNGDATITLDIRQFRSKMMNGKPKNRITSKNWPILAKFVFFIFHRIELVHGMLQLHSTSDSSGL
jgi:hypothetical protein